MKEDEQSSSFFVCIRFIRVISVRFGSLRIRQIRRILFRIGSERNNHNYHNYPRNNILSFIACGDVVYLTQKSQKFSVIPFYFRFFRYKNLCANHHENYFYLSLNCLFFYFPQKSQKSQKGHAA